MSDEDWTTAAVCAQGIADLWHSPDAHQRIRAVGLCHTCPVRAQCHTEREQLLDNGAHLFGVWAGTDYGMAKGHLRVRLRQEPEHGTANGARQHYRLGTTMCEPCRTAQRAMNAERRAVAS